MNAALIPPPPQPPHDPLTCILDARVGWNAASLNAVEQSAQTGVLKMSTISEGGVSLFDPYGSFGGRVLPKNLAIVDCSVIYLMNTAEQTVRRFDPCVCQFEDVPCTGQSGSNPREFLGAESIGIDCQTLYVCDSDNNRLQLFRLPGFLLQNIWYSPATLNFPWQPVDIAFTNKKGILVADRANSAVHVLDRFGVLQRTLTGFGVPVAITLDNEGRLHVLPSGLDRIYLVDIDSGAEIGSYLKAGAIPATFPEMLFPLHPDSIMDLSDYCVEESGTGLFDHSGNRVSAPGEQLLAVYPAEGEFLSEEIDSEIHECQWDRVELGVYVPPRTRLKVLTYTAEAPIPASMIQTLPDSHWSNAQTIHADENTPEFVSDLMVRSAPGRYLWLKIVFQTESSVTPWIERISIRYPRISLSRYLPAAFGVEPVSADFTDRFLAIFDQTFRSVESHIDHQARLFDPLSAPAESGSSDFLGWLGSWIGIRLQRQWPLQRQREYLKKAGALSKLRGTLGGLQAQLYLYLGLDRSVSTCKPFNPCGPCRLEDWPEWRPPPLILEHFKLRRWLFVNSGRLGESARLWGQKLVNRTQLSGEDVEGNSQLGVSELNKIKDPLRDPFHFYAHKFSVFVPSSIIRNPGLRKGLEGLLESERPAHAQYQIEYVEPRFRIGIQSMIGFDSVIACYQTGYQLDDSTRLGKATILSSAPDYGESKQIGRTARLQ